MKSIKFSRVYRKFPSTDDPSVLLQVFAVDRKELTASFVSYDATDENGELYELPSRGLVLVLLLYQECNNHLWTTIRRQTPKKEAYYRSMIGKEFAMDYPHEEE